jgi:hypothetical protein
MKWGESSFSHISERLPPNRGWPISHRVLLQKMWVGSTGCQEATGKICFRNTFPPDVTCIDF